MKNLFKDLGVKFGCFITGHNYLIVKNSSEASAKAVKKYLSAILIISALWGFIGYVFTQRYLDGNAFIGALSMAILVIQIERQIILEVERNALAYSFRILIGLVMAIIGSIILDQIIFKDDVEKAQISNVQNEVNRLLPIKTQELTSQIQEIDNSIKQKETERRFTIKDIEANPTLNIPSSSVKYQMDTTTKKIVEINKTVTTNSIRNPKADFIPQIDAQIKFLREQKTLKENNKLNIQQVLETDLKSKIGFIDELKILFSILLTSGVALFVWILIFIFFIAIELFVLINKFSGKNDYDITVINQMNTRIKMLNDEYDISVKLKLNADVDVTGSVFLRGLHQQILNGQRTVIDGAFRTNMVNTSHIKKVFDDLPL